MHPVLARMSRLGLYLAAWIPLTGMLVYLVAGPTGLGWLETAAIVVPLCLIYAFVCLSAWYSCRMTPLARSGVLRLILTHMTAAVVLSALWVLAGRALAGALSGWVAFAGFEQDRFARHVVPLLLAAGMFLYLLAVAFHYVLLAVEASRQAERGEMEARVLAREAELKALKAQVNPHFLFNSLHSISALTTADPARAREMCVLLSDFLRKTLGLGEKSSIPLEEEISLVDSFLAVEKMRFGSRLRIQQAVEEDSRHLLVPPLLLQPLVENAVTHGVANLPEGGWIRLEARRAGGGLSIVVENVFDPETPSRRRNGMGLANVRKRLEARYGAGASLNVRVADDCYRVEVTLPAEEAEAGA